MPGGWRSRTTCAATASTPTCCRASVPSLYRVRRRIRGRPLVSLIIPTAARLRDVNGTPVDLLANAIRSVVQKTAYDAYEFIIVADDAGVPATTARALEGTRHTVLPFARLGLFNFSAKINAGVSASSGEHVLLFNDDLEATSPEWLSAMLEYSQEPAIGAVGAKLLYPDGRLQHIGMVLGVAGLAAHAFHQYPGVSPGYSGSAIMTRNYSAVTAACLMTRRRVFDDVGGFDERFPIDFNDVDYCLRLRRAGYRSRFHAVGAAVPSRVRQLRRATTGPRRAGRDAPPMGQRDRSRSVLQSESDARLPGLSARCVIAMRDIDSEAPRRRGARARWIGIVLFVGLIVVPLVTVAIASTRLFPPGGRVLEIELVAKGGTYAQIFWSGDFAMSQSSSSMAMLHQGQGAFDTLRFPLPRKPLEMLRLDPLDGPGEVLIRRMRVVDDRGRTVRTIDPLVMMALHQIAFMRPEPDGIRVITKPDANDPMLVMRSSWLVEAPRWYSLQFVTPFSLAWIAAAVLVLVSTGLAFILREIRAGPISRRDALWFAALVLTLVWAKLALLQQYPAPVPFWDQWDGEAWTLYIPWADQGVTWRQMFTFHNEHRIFFSRLLALTLLVTNGQWDPHLQIVVNALLHSLAALVVAAVLWLAIGRRYLPGVILAVGLSVAPPFAIENSLVGFQSAFYLLVLFSVLALWLMGTSRPGTAPWFLGWLFALCCPFTVAGGILILPAIAVVNVFRAIADRWGWRLLAASAVALAAVAAVGYGGLPPPIAAHEALKAGTVRNFEIAFARSLAFPWINYPRATVLMWLPLAASGLLILWRRLRATAIEQITLAMGLWVVLQCAAVAYSRGANGAAPASRYLDVVALGYLANTVTILSWLNPRNGRRVAAAGAIGLVAWIAMSSLGIKRVSEEMLALHGPMRRQWTRQHLRNVRQFVITDNVKEFVELRGPQEVPYLQPPRARSLARTPLRPAHPAGRRSIAPRRPADRRVCRSRPAGGTAGSGLPAARLRFVFERCRLGCGSLREPAGHLSGPRLSPLRDRQLGELVGPAVVAPERGIWGRDRGRPTVARPRRLGGSRRPMSDGPIQSRGRRFVADIMVRIQATR